MKFIKKFHLDESIDDTSYGSCSTNVQANNLYDDDFSAPDYMPEIHTEEPLSGPDIGSDCGIADFLIAAINDEWEAIRQYNSLIATLKHESINNPIYNSFVNVVEEINNEENRHVGQLQEVLKQISPNVESINKGQEESKVQLQSSLLNVQSWHESNSTQSSANQVETNCTLTNIDDEM